MPNGDGYEATAKIRSLEQAQQLPRTPIIALTASALDSDRVAVLDAGCDDIVLKPFQQRALLVTFERFLGASFHFSEETDPDARASVPGGNLVARLAAAPAEARAELHQALVAGDDLVAHRVCDELAAAHPQLAADLHQLIAAFQIDQVLHLLEQAAGR
jgi:CheY-like chemotaxis protein